MIPANLGLAEAELILAGQDGPRADAAKRAARGEARATTSILIDCPPTLGLLTVNALFAADRALLSTEAEYFSLQGVEQALEVIALARENLNPELEVLGVVLNIANMRTQATRARRWRRCASTSATHVFETVIRRSIAYAESAERAIPILDYRPDRGVDYLRLRAEMFERLEHARAQARGRSCELRRRARPERGETPRHAARASGSRAHRHEPASTAATRGSDTRPTEALVAPSGGRRSAARSPARRSR